MTHKGVYRYKRPMNSILSILKLHLSILSVNSFSCKRFSISSNLLSCSSFVVPYTKATKAEPLHRLLHKDTKFRWGPEQEKSFNQLKQSLIDASNLSYFDLNAETQVIADASPVGLGAVLVQKQNNEYKVICYASRSLTAIERKYSQTEREALGLVL
jgi:hypothetical protein